MNCEGTDCWFSKKAKWRPNLKKWLCDFHYRKFMALSIGDIYS